MIKEYKLIIGADYNDGDYDYCFSDVTQQELERFLILIKKLPKTNHTISWESYEDINSQRHPSKKYKKKLNKDDYNFLDNLFPVGENGCGIHTIVRIWYAPLVVCINVL